jgi:hypothetical protein
MPWYWNFIAFGKYPTFEVINLLMHKGMWRHLERKKGGGDSGDLGVNGGMQARCCWRIFFERKLWVKSFKLALRRVLSYAWIPLGFRVYRMTHETPKEYKHEFLVPILNHQKLYQIGSNWQRHVCVSFSPLIFDLLLLVALLFHILFLTLVKFKLSSKVTSCNPCSFFGFDFLVGCVQVLWGPIPRNLDHSF